MEQIVAQIQSAIRQFETVLLPKLSMVSSNPRDAQELNKRLEELRRIEQEASQPPGFSIRFLGDTQNGKSTLINVLLGRKVLPEGHVGACSATIVRCRYKKQKDITIEFRYATKDDFQRDLEQKCQDAELVLVEEESEAKRREVVCGLLGRFLRLFEIEAESIPDTAELISRCRQQSDDFHEMELLGTIEKLVVGPDTEKAISQNLSARGRRAFIVDECLIEGPFSDWHPAMELVDMPGTNAFNPYDDQVNARLKQKVGGLAIVTKETQLHSTVMDWFKESSILPDVAGASERNQVRVFVLKTFVDQLNLNEDDEQSPWEQTRAYCGEIGKHLKQQIMNLVHQRYSAPNEIEVLKAFVNQLPVHYLSPRVYRALDDEGVRKRVLGDPLNHMALADGFRRFNQKPENTGIPTLKRDFQQQTDSYIQNNFWKKIQLDYRKETDLVVHFFRVKRVGIEQRLVDQGAAIHKINEDLRGQLLRCVGSHHEVTEKTIVNLKRSFESDFVDLLNTVATDFGCKTRSRLNDWMSLHGASLRCAGRKHGQHVTKRGHEIDFNGNLADFCVEALNSTWIAHRSSLRKQLLENLRVEFIPSLEKLVFQAKGREAKLTKLIETTYQELAEQVKQNLDLELAKYDAEAARFDAIRPALMLRIREFLIPTYQAIADESGTGSFARIRNHLHEGVMSSTLNVGRLVKDTVRQNWTGLTAAIEKLADGLFEEIRARIKSVAAELDSQAAHPSEHDEERVRVCRELERAIALWDGKEAA